MKNISERYYNRKEKSSAPYGAHLGEVQPPARQTPRNWFLGPNLMTEVLLLRWLSHDLLARREEVGLYLLPTQNLFI